jgi:enamine deaminase RidA (YjgF/YER057c/UK114 family)
MLKRLLKILTLGAVLTAPSATNATDTDVVRLNPDGVPDASALGYSQVSVVESGSLAFVSGQVAWKEPFGKAPATLEEQTSVVLDNASAILSSLGAEKEDIVMVRLYVTDLTPERLNLFYPIVVNWFGGAKPSLTGVGVAALAAPDLQIEMEMTVRVSK